MAVDSDLEEMPKAAFWAAPLGHLWALFTLKMGTKAVQLCCLEWGLHGICVVRWSLVRAGCADQTYAEGGWFGGGQVGCGQWEAMVTAKPWRCSVSTDGGLLGSCKEHAVYWPAKGDCVWGENLFFLWVKGSLRAQALCRALMRVAVPIPAAPAQALGPRPLLSRPHVLCAMALHCHAGYNRLDWEGRCLTRQDNSWRWMKSHHMWGIVLSPWCGSPQSTSQNISQVPLSFPIYRWQNRAPEGLARRWVSRPHWLGSGLFPFSVRLLPSGRRTSASEVACHQTNDTPLEAVRDHTSSSQTRRVIYMMVSVKPVFCEAGAERIGQGRHQCPLLWTPGWAFGLTPSFPYYTQSYCKNAHTDLSRVGQGAHIRWYLWRKFT